MVDGISFTGRRSSIAIAPDGNPIISYDAEPNSLLKVAKCSQPDCSGTISLSTVDQSLGLDSPDTSITIGSDGRPIISYLSSNEGLLVAWCHNLSCSSFTITPLDVLGAPPGTSITVGTDGLAVISYSC